MTATAPRLRIEALLVFIAAIAATMALKAGFSEVIWKYAGPATLAVTLIAATAYLHYRGETWSALGLRSPGGWKGWLLLAPQTLLGIVAILGVGVTSSFVGESLGLWSTETLPEGVEQRWGDIAGQLGPYLVWLTLGIISGGLFEEMFFRAFLISRLRKVFGDGDFGRSVWAIGLSILLPAIYFGYGHVYYQGLRGLVTTGLIGLALGLLYVLYKRNLWPLILAHAAVDSLAFTAMYLELDI